MPRGKVVVLLRSLVLEDINPRLFSAVALATALIYFFCLFDLSLVTDGDFWRFSHTDAAQHYIGFLYFFRDEWRFPLFYTPNLGFPGGTNIIFTDSIPLAALLSKLLRPILPEGFHPFGLWIILCYLLLAHAFSSLLYNFGYRSLVVAAVGSVFAVMNSVFPRLDHAALSAHFLIVYALLQYFKCTDNPEKLGRFVVFYALLVVSLLTHIYLFAMVACIYGCTLLSLALRPERSLRELALWLASPCAIVGGTILLSGHLSASIPFADSSEYGYFSMNLLSPVIIGRNYEGFRYWVVGAILLGIAALMVTYLNWNKSKWRILGLNALGLTLFFTIARLNAHYNSFPDATGGQYEGVNYWGAGIFFLICACLGAFIHDIREIGSARYWPLALGLVVLTILAVSNKAYVGQHELFSFQLPGVFNALAGQFRSSGRFFWVVTYSVMALAISKALSLRPQWLGTSLVIGSLGLQALDMRVIIDEVKYAVHQPLPQSLSETPWRPIIAAHRQVVIVPPTQCGGSTKVYGKIGRISAQTDVPLASVWAARYPAAALDSCSTITSDIIEQGFRPGNLYVVTDEKLFPVKQIPSMRKYCSEMEGITFCTLLRETLRLP